MRKLSLLSESSLRSFVIHAISWVLIALILVAARGVRWDEDFEFAQVLTGQVVYPMGHPLPVYLSKALSIQPHLAAEWLRLGAPEGYINGLRNWLYLCATVLPAFLFGASLTRSMACGHIAAIAMLQGWILEFDGSYPHNPWPTLYSNGHIGTGWALLTLYALIHRQWFWAVLLAALMPAVHIGQAAPLGLLCAGYGVHAIWKRDPNLWREAVPAMLLAAVAWACLLWRMREVAPLGAMPESEAFPSVDLFVQFIAHHDPHRRIPGVLAHVAAGLCLVQSMLAWRTESNANLRGFYLGVALYAFVTCLLLYPIASLHLLLGPEKIAVLLLWMPYRLINHLGPLWIVVSLGMLARSPRGLAITFLVVGIATLRPLWQLVMTDEVFRRYLFAGEMFPLLLAGAAFGILSGSNRYVVVPRSGAALGFLLLLPFHQFGAACLLGGFALGRIPTIESLAIRLRPVGFSWGLLAVALLLAGWNEYRHREHLPRTDLDRALLTLGTEPSDRHVLVGPPDAYALQARTGMPVLYDAATASYVTYAPKLGPAIRMISRGVYGFRFEAGQVSPSWQEVWQKRDPIEWAAIGRQWEVGYVVTPVDLALNLQQVAETSSGRIYAIPEFKSPYP